MPAEPGFWTATHQSALDSARSNGYHWKEYAVQQLSAADGVLNAAELEEAWQYWLNEYEDLHVPGSFGKVYQYIYDSQAGITYVSISV